MAAGVETASGRIRAEAGDAQPAIAGQSAFGAVLMRRAGLSRIALGIVVCVATVAWAAAAAAQGAGDERRVALVVGNSNYDHVPRLTNPGNDAALIAATL